MTPKMTPGSITPLVEGLAPASGSAASSNTITLNINLTSEPNSSPNPNVTVIVNVGCNCSDKKCKNGQSCGAQVASVTFNGSCEPKGRADKKTPLDPEELEKRRARTLPARMKRQENRMLKKEGKGW
ncbi:hypothetical protein HDE_03559 [Halotydeus destructor]|nr:hypothetical protein HDE_03559 [Halotydeus destructor]